MKKKQKPLTKYWEETFELLNWFTEYFRNKRNEEIAMLKEYQSLYKNYVTEELKVLDDFKQSTYR